MRIGPLFHLLRLSFQLAVPLFLMLPAVDRVTAQQFGKIGTYVVGAYNRTPSSQEPFKLGDQINVSVKYPANFGRIYVSAHMEYLSDEGSWHPVAVANTAQALKYRSGAYPGVRDYVVYPGYSENQILHASFFIPFDAADFLPGQLFERRYVLRLWDGANQEISSVSLPGDKIEVVDENGITKISSKAKGNEQSEIRLFDTRTGNWLKLTELQPEIDACGLSDVEQPNEEVARRNL